MHGMDKSLQELLGMLRIADDDMKKRSSIFMIQEGGRKIKKKKRKWLLKYKGKVKQVPNQNTPKIKVSATSDCYYNNGKSHWKRNCPKYLADLKSGIVSKSSISDTFVVKVMLLPLFLIGYWIPDHVLIYVRIYRH